MLATESLADLVIQCEILRARNQGKAQATIWDRLSRRTAGKVWSNFARAVVALGLNPRYAVKVVASDDRTRQIVLIDREKVS